MMEKSLVGVYTKLWVQPEINRWKCFGDLQKLVKPSAINLATRIFGSNNGFLPTFTVNVRCSYLTLLLHIEPY